VFRGKKKGGKYRIKPSSKLNFFMPKNEKKGKMKRYQTSSTIATTAGKGVYVLIYNAYYRYWYTFLSEKRG
jgi:hypothetical protein